MKDLVKEDYDFFREKGFEVIKGANGQYYVRPYPPVSIDQDKFLQAKTKAESCGFIFDMNGFIFNYEKLKE